MSFIVGLLQRPFSLAPTEDEDPFPSLSGFHDFEPRLEFDDAEIIEEDLSERKNLWAYKGEPSKT